LTAEGHAVAKVENDAQPAALPPVSMSDEQRASDAASPSVGMVPGTSRQPFTAFHAGGMNPSPLQTELPPVTRVASTAALAVDAIVPIPGTDGDNQLQALVSNPLLTGEELTLEEPDAPRSVRMLLQTLLCTVLCHIIAQTGGW